MSVRLHELHPSLVHFPLVLVPLAFLSDLIGRMTGSASLMRLGKGLMPVAAASGVVTAAAGLAAQEAVVRTAEANDLLVTHRNLNAGLVGMVAGLAVARARRSYPGTGYLLGGMMIMAGMAYTAYLGGKLVYRHGVGVAPAGGVRDGRSPDIAREGLAESARIAAGNVIEAARNAARDIAQGRIAPSLRKD